MQTSEENCGVIMELCARCNVMADDMSGTAAPICRSVGLHVEQAIWNYANITHILILQHSGSKLL
jgi:hypothetical protein